ncbi:MAG: 3-deoxy-7-phosphoheptulonate synthase [Deltaproteobacteria bacterium]|nr:3-deoxy-7-phosphoheptulonate synthase [Deltaproteobacteria bacterium]
MLLVSMRDARAAEVRAVEALLRSHAEVAARVPDGAGVTLLARSSNGELAPVAERIGRMPGVARVARIDSRYVLSAREAAPGRTAVRVDEGLEVGGREFVVIAGPCSVESGPQMRATARAVAGAGARALRGGAFKPRTSPFSFQGLGEEGLAILADVRRETGLAVVSELLGPRSLEAVDATVDVIQVGMRNALNYSLLKELGRLPSRRPVLLKCGIGTSLDEFLCAADYVLAGGNPNVILCLRGTVGFSQESRCALNLVDIPALRARTHLPIVVDPSHAAGRWEFVPAVAASALVAGADGLLVEVHHDPAAALSDADQSLKPSRFHRMMHRLSLLAPVLGRTIADLTTPVCDPEGHPMGDLCLEAPTAGLQPSCVAAATTAREACHGE